MIRTPLLVVIAILIFFSIPYEVFGVKIYLKDGTVLTGAIKK